jgi:hypothetical protein
MKAAQLTPAAAPAKKSNPFFNTGGEQDFFHGSSINEQPFFSKSKNNNYGIQTKLTVGATNDVYEKEADTMAHKVVQRLTQPEVVSKKDQSVQTKTSSTSFSPFVQKKCAHCEEEEKLQKEKEHKGKERIQKKPIFESDAEPPDDDKKVQRKCAECEKEEKLQKKSNTESTPASSTIESNLNSSKGRGSTLPAATREQMESSFGADFSNVRIHNDSSAVQMSRDLNALAFTHGNDIYFNSGKYDANSEGGKHLLAHELTHVVQQNGNGIQRKSEKKFKNQSFLKVSGNKVQKFDLPFGYETDISWSGLKTAAGLTADAAKATGKWVYNRGKFIVGNAYDCAKATGSSIRRLVTGDFDSLADLLGMPKPGEDGPSMTDFISFVITHPCLKMIPGYEAVEYTVDKFSSVSKFLKGAWHMAKNPDETIEAIHTSPFLTGMVGGISPATLAIAMKAVTFSTPSAEIVKGIYRHLTPKLDYLAANWWEVLKAAAWDLVWPWPGVGKDLGVIWDQLGKCVDNLWNLNISNAADNLLTIWRTVNGMLGRLYGWFLIASVLIGAIIGAFFGGAGAIPGALLGFEFAMSVGQGLLISTIAAETATIGKAGLDVVFKNLTPEEKENNFEKIANSGITLAITGIMVALGELAVRFAKGLIDKISGLFISAEEGVGATSGGIGKGGGSSGSNSQGGQSWTPRVIQGGKSAVPSTRPVAQGGSSGGTIGNTAVKIEPAPIVEPPPKPNLKIVPDLPPSVKTPTLPANTGPVLGGLAGAEAAKKLKEKTEEEQKKKKTCYRTSRILRVSGLGLMPLGVAPTPDDLRIPGCMLRTVTGTTDYDFTFRNIAVARFVVNGNTEYIAAPNPEGNIHSEDEIFRLAEKRFGRGNFTLSALFSERVPCARCSGWIPRFPRTSDCLIYCIVKDDKNWRQIRENYNNGILF